MRSRLLILGAVVVAAGIGATVWVVTRPTRPASPLDAVAAPACPGSPSGRCTAPGTVRWMLPLPGTYDLDGATGTLATQVTSAVAEQIHRDQNAAMVPSASPAATLADGLLVYQQGGLVEAIDPATGKVRWRDRLARGAALLTMGEPVASGNLVAATAMPRDADPSQARVWELSAASGAVDADIPLASGLAVVAPVAGGVVVVRTALSQNDYNDLFEDLTGPSGAPSWQAGLPPIPQPPELIGDVLYARNVAGTAIERLDLGTGRVLPPLPLPAPLRGPTVSVQAALIEGSPGDGVASSVLVAASSSAVARIDLATGQPAWTLTAPNPSAEPSLTVDPASSPPVGVYFVLLGANGPSRMTMVSLASGQTIRTITLSDPMTGQYVGQGASEMFLGQNLAGLVYNSLEITYSNIPAAGASQGLTRLAGLDLGTGRDHWKGPLMSGDLQVLGWTTAGPPAIIAEACAPGGMHIQDENLITGYPDGTCTAARIFAVNA